MGKDKLDMAILIIFGLPFVKEKNVSNTSCADVFLGLFACTDFAVPYTKFKFVLIPIL
jgi:hypothetical protein